MSNILTTFAAQNHSNGCARHEKGPLHMKQKLLLFAALMFGLSVYAENLVIQTMSQQEKRQALETFGRLEFNHEQGEVSLVLKDGSIAGTYYIDAVRKIFFADDTQDLNNVNDGLAIDVRGDELVVKGLDEPITLRVIDASGKVLLTEKGVSIGVSSLPTGVYLLQCNKGIVKFIKK